MTTKKKGRDDARIARDKKKAMASRKAKRSTKKANGGKKKNRVSSPSTDGLSSDESSMQEFIVDDDEELSEHEDSSEEDELEILDSKPPPRNKSKRDADAMDSSSDEEESLLPSYERRASKPAPHMSHRAKPGQATKKKPVNPFSAFAARSSKPKAKKGDKGGVLGTLSSLPNDSDSDTDSDIEVKHKQKLNKKRRVVVDDDTPMKDNFDSADEDEQVAVAIAMSLQDSKKKKQYIHELQDSSDESDREEEDEAEEEVFVDDKDAKTAASVLATANELSAQVLRNMQQWIASPSSSSEAKAPVGMIVDGALALSGMTEEVDSGANHKHKWISQEQMREICPGVTLASYQLIAVNWMALLHGMQVQVEGNKKTNVNGVLADEMGLGKTVQTIAFLAWLKQQNSKDLPVVSLGSTKEEALDIDDSEDDDEDGDYGNDSSPHNKVSDAYLPPHLIVVPPSVLSNWEREFQKFAPHMTVVKYHGTQNERLELQEQLRIHLPKFARARAQSMVDRLDVILAPATYFQREKSEDRTFLRKFNFDYLVVDEAHLLKNAKTLRYRKMDQFQTEHRLLLTGTPVQNSPRELMSLLCFMMPLFSRKSGGFDDEEGGSDGGESMLQHFVSMQAEGGAEVDDTRAYKKLKQLFAPFVLRRRKRDVLKQIMPPKEKKVELVELTESSKLVYDNILSNHMKSKKAGVRAYENLFSELRKAAHHPLLLRTRYRSALEKKKLAGLFHQFGAFQGDGAKLFRVEEELAKMSDFEIHLMALDLIGANEGRREQLSKYVLDEQDLFSSAKFLRLRSLLPDLITRGHRILIFSVWTTCLDLLTCLMDHLDLRYLRMDGSTPVNERQTLIDQYSNDKSIPIFLLSTKACGLGINLTSADTCIMHDIDFNPFNDLQAEDRVHRIGQKKTTTVIKLVTQNTVDSDIFEMQQKKARMNAAIMENESEWNKDSKATKEMVLKTAVERFLKSPDKTGASDDADDEVKVLERECM